ncbi:MAG: hypothetical protein CVU47_02230 [Chloroflexi bacterium HGW-Chloroflexi-9]|nr:MAG: hypothetical protein CVU47_02230 [Chloroflexi bacterium HGW-Chloroflexi-9]
MSTPRPVTALLGLSCAAMLLLAGCRGGDDTPPASTPPPGTVEGTSTPVPGEPGESPTPEATTDTGELRDLMLSSLTATATSAQMDRALAALEVESFPLDVPGREVWFALSTGSGVYELPAAAHVAGIYDHRADGSWVETARLVLESAPSVASAEIVPIRGSSGFPIWIAVTGNTGAHSGTFELLRYNGTSLSTELWWFSPSPDAALITDLDADGMPEIVLNASDPYVFCYACGVEDYAEVIYRWQDEQPTLVSIVDEPGESETAFLNSRAVRLVEADLWREALATIEAARTAAPDDTVIMWNAIQIRRIAAVRLAQAGKPQQPLVTDVLAGEYGPALDLIRSLSPAEVFDASGPLVSDTVAVGAQEAMGQYLLDHATRALAVSPEMHEAYAVRAVGQVLLRSDAWGEAIADMDAAAALQPDEPFYQAAIEYLLVQNGGVRG